MGRATRRSVACAASGAGYSARPAQWGIIAAVARGQMRRPIDHPEGAAARYVAAILTHFLCNEDDVSRFRSNPWACMPGYQQERAQEEVSMGCPKEAKASRTPVGRERGRDGPSGPDGTVCGVRGDTPRGELRKVGRRGLRSRGPPPTIRKSTSSGTTSAPPPSRSPRRSSRGVLDALRVGERGRPHAVRRRCTARGSSIHGPARCNGRSRAALARRIAAARAARHRRRRTNDRLSSISRQAPQAWPAPAL